MKIVVLDADPAFGSGGAANRPILAPIDAPSLFELGDVTTYAATSPAQIVERAADAEVLLTNKVPLCEEEFAALPRLRLVSVLATGVNVIDLAAAVRHGVTVCNVAGYSTASTAQHTFSLLLELCQQVGLHATAVNAGGWIASPSFSFFKSQLVELDGLTMGVCGLGAIGQKVAIIAQAFGMKVIAFTRTPRDVPGVELVSKERLLRSSDVVSLHCPLTEQTHHLIDDQALALMKPEALLINVARGPVMDEAAVARALAEERLAGLATDVLSEEPPRADNPLLCSPRCIITPHIAWATTAARKRLIALSVENIVQFYRGTPKNVVAEP